MKGIVISGCHMIGCHIFLVVTYLAVTHLVVPETSGGNRFYWLPQSDRELRKSYFDI